jgi:DNA polymerase-3 subunit delta'
MSAAALPDLFWLEPQRQQLRQARAQQRLPHALLIHDVPGGGGGHLALYAARLALCSAATAPCGQCRECQRLTGAQPGVVESIRHPDLFWLSPIPEGEKASQHISIAQVRALRSELSRTSHGSSGASVAILSPADSMLPPASNALLKTLEEPRSGTLIVLLTAAPGALLATLRSRCLRLRVQVPARSLLVEWLQQARGAADWPAVLDVLGEAPLLALDADARHLADVRRDTHAALDRVATGNAEAIVPLAYNWSRAEQLSTRLACIENWITARIDAGFAKSRDGVAMRGGARLPERGTAANIAALVRAHDAVRELARLATSPINKALALELVFWQLSRSSNPASSNG